MSIAPITITKNTRSSQKPTILVKRCNTYRWTSATLAESVIRRVRRDPPPPAASPARRPQSRPCSQRTPPCDRPGCRTCWRSRTGPRAWLERLFRHGDLSCLGACCRGSGKSYILISGFKNGDDEGLGGKIIALKFEKIRWYVQLVKWVVVIFRFLNG